jgi:hypothetical protein
MLPHRVLQRPRACWAPPPAGRAGLDREPGDTQAMGQAELLIAGLLVAVAVTARG